MMKINVVRLLPLTILVAAAVLTLRISDLAVAVVTGGAVPVQLSVAIAQDTAGQDTAGQDTAGQDTAGQDTAGQDTAGQDGADSDASADGPGDPSTAETDAAAAQPGVPASGQEAELLRQLRARRQELDERAARLDEREALILAAETRVDQKVAEMGQLRDEIQALLQEKTAEEEAQLASLVETYERMKPKDAAPIFNNLEMEVLLDLLVRMRVTKRAPIFAEMDPRRAQEVTIELASREELLSE